MSSHYEMEIENIIERTHYGRMMYVKNGGKLGLLRRSSETDRDFLKKETSVEIQKYLGKGFTIHEITKVVVCSPNTVVKVKNIGSVSLATNQNTKLSDKP